MTKVRLYVGLKVPDATAITAFSTLKRIGFSLKGLSRLEYYEFDVLKDAEKFMKEIVDVDVLVNHNKNTAKVSIEPIKDNLCILVRNTGDRCEKLFSLLRERLGFIHISGMSRGTLWLLDGCNRETAEEIADKLLCNEHYQDFLVTP